jgi:hypothetical protein
MDAFPRRIDELDVLCAKSLCAKSLCAKSLRATSIDGRKCNFLRNESHLRAEICKIPAMPPASIGEFCTVDAPTPAASVKRFTDSVLPPG